MLVQVAYNAMIIRNEMELFAGGGRAPSYIISPEKKKMFEGTVCKVVLLNNGKSWNTSSLYSIT